MPSRLVVTVLSALLLSAVPLWAQAPTPATAQTAPAAPAEPLRTAGERPVDVRHIRLDLKVELAGKGVDGVATLDVRALRELPLLRLDAVGLNVKEVTAAKAGQDPAAVKFHTEDRSLVIDLAPAWAAGQEGVVRVTYRVADPREGLHFHGPSAADPKAPLTVWSQGEPVSNRYWFPCLDIPDERQTTELVVTAPAGNEVLSNGKLVGRKENAADGTVTFHWLQDKPHPSYLVTLVVGKFDVVREEWDGVPVTYYVPAGEKDLVGRTFGRTREMRDFFSREFGVKYHASHVWKVLGQLGWSCQRPERKARERNEEAIRRWVRYRWPRIKKRRVTLVRS
jgi:aminopeptidase N